MDRNFDSNALFEKSQSLTQIASRPANPDPDGRAQVEAMKAFLTSLENLAIPVVVTGPDAVVTAQVATSLGKVPAIGSHFEISSVSWNRKTEQTLNRIKGKRWVASVYGVHEEAQLTFEAFQPTELGRSSLELLKGDEFSQISRSHLKVRIETLGTEDKVLVTDCSRNGTYLRGRRLSQNEETIVPEGEEIVMGGGEFAFGCPAVRFRRLPDPEPPAEVKKLIQAAVCVWIQPPGQPLKDIEGLLRLLGSAIDATQVLVITDPEPIPVRLDAGDLTVSVVERKPEKADELLIGELLGSCQATLEESEPARLTRRYLSLKRWVGAFVERNLFDIERAAKQKEVQKSRGGDEARRIQSALAISTELTKYFADIKTEADRVKDDLENRTLGESAGTFARRQVENAQATFGKDSLRKVLSLYFDIEPIAGSDGKHFKMAKRLTAAEAEAFAKRFHEQVVQAVSSYVRSKFEVITPGVDGTYQASRKGALSVRDSLLRLDDVARTLPGWNANRTNQQFSELDHYRTELKSRFDRLETKEMQMAASEAQTKLQFSGGVVLQQMVRTIRTSLMTAAMLAVFVSSQSGGGSYMAIATEIKKYVPTWLMVLILLCMVGYTWFVNQSEQKERLQKLVDAEREKLVSHYVNVAQTCVRSFDREYRTLLAEMQEWVTRETGSISEVLTARLNEIAPRTSMADSMGDRARDEMLKVQKALQRI